ncbi:CaiB/BaiF CoA-transferase family protein [Rhodococcus opacus]|uniref:CaiB/BaiF CoA-transferase family protein n=1 Tax=Rhodococcus opacus TaxID=37919 RepID=UPI001C440EBF|nr:CoA transferase [Rhodococcus opacus]MBV6756211.1 CoA transferase [Rhodococcus opacus]
MSTPTDTALDPRPLDGVVVIDMSTTMPGAWATQFLADAGADVVVIETSQGNPLRAMAAWPAVAGGKRSVVLDLNDPHELETLRALLRTADVLVSSVERGPEEPGYLSREEVAELNPRLVHAITSAWGPSGPLVDLNGDVGLVMAKLGMYHAKARLTSRPGPSFVTTPFAQWGAAQTTVHGILAALIERESSGMGQLVQTDLVRGVSILDVWGWYTELVGLKWPGAFEVVDAYTPEGEPLSFMTLALLSAPTKDGHWLQFAQTEARLLSAFVEELGLKDMLAEPRWAGFPMFPEQKERTEFWEMMFTEVGKRTLAEWQHVFDTNPNISAELFRTESDALDHAQLQHDGRVVIVDDPERGPVRRPSTLVHAGGRPLSPPRPAPTLGQHTDEAKANADTAHAHDTPNPPTPAPAPATLPLEGVTILDFGVMFAAPFGATLLADLGARVIKIETLDGDSIRNVLPFPEVGGGRVMQGKQSIQVDIRTPDGQKIVHELVKRCDIVLQPFRAGAAERTGVDEKALLAIKPDLVYVNAPGYGTSGPWGSRPAYAPSVAAAVGISLADAPDALNAAGDLQLVKKASVRLNSAAAVPPLQADGLAAAGVASGMLLGWYAKLRGRPLEPLTLTMLATGTHAMLDRVVDYEGRPPVDHPDHESYGLSALYRLYPTARGWVFLAADSPGDWQTLVSALADECDLAQDGRFTTARERTANDAELAAVIGQIFAGRSAEEWEKLLTAGGVGCVEAAEKQPGAVMMTDPAMSAEYASTTTGAVFDEHLRMGPSVTFSRSLTQANGGCLAGEHTVEILHEIGYTEATIEDLRARRIIDGH